MAIEKYVSGADTVAIMLAGGLGERLIGLTWYRTKPAVMIGGNNLASFSSSNALNSGIGHILIATQYLPRSLGRFYVKIYGNSGEFGPERKIDVITPNDTVPDAARYKGTADALYNALQIAKTHNKKFVLVLSGDHIYKYDFNELFTDFYQKYDEDAFVVLSQKVPRDDTSRFGILKTKPGSSRVIAWDEKPTKEKLPESQKEFDAGLGIYFGRTEVFEKILDMYREMSSRGLMIDDIGKGILPALIENKKVPVYAHPMPNFWADVGTTRALFDAAQRIYIERNPDIIGDETWKIAGLGEPKFVNIDGHRYFNSGRFEESGSTINNAIFSPGVVLDRAYVLDAIVLGESRGVATNIGYNAQISNAIIDKASTVGNNAVVRSEEGLITVVKGTNIHPRIRAEAEGYGIVAEFEEMKRFKDRIDPSLELFLPDGARITLDELVA